MIGPTLTTDRLALSPPAPGDLDETAAMWADERVTRHIGGRPLTREECWRNIQRHHGHWALFGWGWFAVRERSAGALVGEVGLMDSRRDTRPSFEGVPEAGWGFVPEHHGRGYAREAMTALLGWADARGLRRSVCIIDPDNAPSIALAGRLGYRPAGAVAYRDGTTLLFERGAD